MESPIIADEVPGDLAAPEAGTQPATVRASMRHPIYVHSKMTIIDDDYVLVP
jgi:phosphatidylserine/phosphatidylglycerophosphate/cardiolipin synthase-like enzyme